MPDKPGGRLRFAPGEVLAGRFRIVRFLARGGTSEVYEADDSATRERVALKVLASDTAGGAGDPARLERQEDMARAVAHPAICAVKGRFTHGKTPFLALELLAGETLDDRLSRSGRMTPEEALAVARPVAAALGAAHAAGFTHGDLSAGNVMLVPERDDGAGARVCVTDFGGAPRPTAQPDASGERSDVVVGTPAYMAPEQAAGEEIGPAADIYALGVLLYEMVTGELPHRGETPVELLTERADRVAPSPRLLVPDLDVRWELTILRCLEPEPLDRFQRVEDVLAALEGGPIARSTRSLALLKRRRRVLIAAAVLVALATAVTAWLLR